MTTRRLHHTATVLADGTVLVTGGQDNVDAFKSLASTEVYNPVAGTWTAKGNMGKSRTYHTATLLPSGKVLVAGGAECSCEIPVGATSCVESRNVLSSAELYDPETGTWTATGSMTMAHYLGTNTLLCNGTVLAVGGYNTNLSDPTLASAEIYDPTTGTWTTTSSMAAASCSHTAVALANGKVLITAGDGRPGGYFLARSEVY
jgi:N-acetylneuraminic acid mutarotase